MLLARLTRNVLVAAMLERKEKRNPSISFFLFWEFLVAMTAHPMRVIKIAESLFGLMAICVYNVEICELDVRDVRFSCKPSIRHLSRSQRISWNRSGRPILEQCALVHSGFAFCFESLMRLSKQCYVQRSHLDTDPTTKEIA
jgi:hypothetical protein